MSCTLSVLDISYDTSEQTLSGGISAEANLISQEVRISYVHLRSARSFTLSNVQSQLFDVAGSCQEPNWDGYGADPITCVTYRMAVAFLKALPLGTPEPTVSPEADGHISFEWYRRPDQLLSVSVSPEGMLYYAAILGVSRRSGTEPLAGHIPEDIRRLITQVYTV